MECKTCKGQMFSKLSKQVYSCIRCGQSVTIRSELEESFEYWWGLFAPTLPKPTRENQLIPGREFACDFVWADRKLVVEIDGGTKLKNGGKHNLDSDRSKINLLVLHGYRVLRFSGTMIRKNPKECVDHVIAGVLGVTP